MSAGRRRKAEGGNLPVPAERAIGLLAPLASPMIPSATALLAITAAMWGLPLRQLVEEELIAFVARVVAS